VLYNLTNMSEWVFCASPARRDVDYFRVSMTHSSRSRDISSRASHCCGLVWWRRRLMATRGLRNLLQRHAAPTNSWDLWAVITDMHPFSWCSLMPWAALAAFFASADFSRTARDTANAGVRIAVCQNTYFTPFSDLNAWLFCVFRNGVPKRRQQTFSLHNLSYKREWRQNFEFARSSPLYSILKSQIITIAKKE